jgi:hypothetical protein
MKNKTMQLFGAIIGIASMVCAWYFYGWQMPVILFLALWSNNIEQK